MALGVAFQAFFKALFDKQSSVRIAAALAEPSADSTKLSAPDKTDKAVPPKPAAPKPTAATRSEALTLLATLQREARLIDLVQESLDGFDDAQIGAAAREVLRDCRQSLQRMFKIEPLADGEEGTSMAIPTTTSPHRMRVVGRAEAATGTIVHRGWQATVCEVPQWKGSANESLLLAPIEIEAG